MDLSSPTDEDHAFKMIDFLLEALGFTKLSASDRTKIL